MARQPDGTILFEDAQILPGPFRNFSGEKRKYNKEGDRNFCVRVDPHVAEMLAKDGWAVKQLKAREDGVPGDFYLKISVGFTILPPMLVLISSKGRVQLGEDECNLLDAIEYRKVDMIVRPYDWGPIDGESGRKAYLKSIFVTIQEDYLDMKYSDVPMLDRNGRKTLALEAGGSQDPNEDIVDAELVEG